jgi:hypothetical protein
MLIMGIREGENRTRRASIAILPMVSFVLAVSGIGFVLSATHNDNFQGWIFFGFFTGCILSLGMLAGYFAIFRLATRFDRYHIALVCLCSGAVIFAWLVFLNIEAAVNIPSNSSVAQSSALSLVTLMNAIEMIWFLLLLRVAIEASTMGRPQAPESKPEKTSFEPAGDSPIRSRTSGRDPT